MIEVNPDDGYLKGNKNYVRISNYIGLIKFIGGGDVGETDLLLVSDSAFEGEAEDQERNVTELSAEPITYKNSKVKIPVLGQDLEINKNGGSLSGALPSEEFGFRIPSLTKRIAARTSIKRIIRHNLGLKHLRD